MNKNNVANIAINTTAIDNNTETWKPIDGYEGLYEVSNMGRVKRLDSSVASRWGKTRIHKGSILKPIPDKDGYLKKQLYKNGKGKYCFIHRLVANAFIENPKGKLQVNHKDGNKSNNHAENLDWVTQSENMKHSYDQLYRIAWLAGRRGKSHPTSKPIICINTNRYFECTRIAAQELKLNSRRICDVLKGRIKHTGGYAFKYA